MYNELMNLLSKKGKKKLKISTTELVFDEDYRFMLNVGSAQWSIIGIYHKNISDLVGLIYITQHATQIYLLVETEEGVLKE